MKLYHQNKKQLIYCIILCLFIFSSCVNISPDCENKSPQIIEIDDSLKKSVYSIVNCKIEGIRYQKDKVNNVENLVFYQNGIKNGVSLEVKNDTIVLKEFDNNLLLNTDTFYLVNNKLHN